MEIIIKSSHVQFKNPQVGQPSKAIEAHYHGRRVEAFVDGRERMFRFEAGDIPFEASDEDIRAAIEARVQAEEPEPEPEE